MNNTDCNPCYFRQATHRHPSWIGLDNSPCRTAWVLQTRTTWYWRFMWSLKTSCSLLKPCSYCCPFNSRSAMLELGWPSIYNTYYLKLYGLIKQPTNHIYSIVYTYRSINYNEIKEGFHYGFWTLYWCPVGIKISIIDIIVTFQVIYPDLRTIFTQDLIF